MTGQSMIGQPSGWYRDPAPRNPQAPDTLRYWDGMAWTPQVRTASKRERQEWLAQDALAYQAQYDELVQRANAGDLDAQRFLSAPTPEGTRATTPDGAELAGWWRRVFATWIDSLLTSILGIALSWRYVKQIATAYDQFLSATLDASRRHAPLPDASSLVKAIAEPVMWMTLIVLAVSACYEIAFLKGYQATPGKMLLGMEVRLRERPGPLPWGAVLLRVVGKSGVGIVQALPTGQLFSSVYYLLDYLWPLWDPNRQALHEKLPGTNVVRR